MKVYFPILQISKLLICLIAFCAITFNVLAQVEINPDSICVTLLSGEIQTETVTITNNGTDSIEGQASTVVNSGGNKIVAIGDTTFFLYTAFTGNIESYTNPFYSDYTIDLVHGFDIPSVETALSTSNVLLIPFYIGGDWNNMFSPELALIIQNYVAAGNTLIINGNSEVIFDALGMFEPLTTSLSYPPTALQIVDTTHPITNFLAGTNTFTATDGILSCNFNDPNWQTFVTKDNGETTHGIFPYGNGQVIFNGSLFYTPTELMSELMANAFQYALSNSNSSWITITTDSQVTINSNDNFQFDITLDATDLMAGTYTSNFVFTSNDPNTGEISIPVKLIVEDISNEEPNGLNTWCKETYLESLIPEFNGSDLVDIINNDDFIYVIANQNFAMFDLKVIVIYQFDNFGNMLNIKHIDIAFNEDYAGGTINDDGDIVISWYYTDNYLTGGYIRIIQIDDNLSFVNQQSYVYTEPGTLFNDKLIFHQGFYYLLGLSGYFYENDGIILIKFDDQLNVVWTKRSYEIKIGEQDVDIVAVDDNIYINTGLNSLVAIDIDGNLQFTSEVVHPLLDDEDVAIYKIAKADENSIVLLGEKSEYGCDEGCTNGVLTQLNTDGTLVQVKEFSINDFNFYLESTSLCNGDFVVSGESSSALPAPDESPSQNLIQFDESLNLIQAKQVSTVYDYNNFGLLHFNNLSTSENGFIVYNDEATKTIHRQHILSESTNNNQCDIWYDVATNVTVDPDFTQVFSTYSLEDYSLLTNYTLLYNEIDQSPFNYFICTTNYNAASPIEAVNDEVTFQGTCNTIIVSPTDNDLPILNIEYEIVSVEDPSFANVTWQPGNQEVIIEAFGQGVITYEVCNGECNCDVGQIIVTEEICPLPPEQLIIEEISLEIGETYMLTTDCVIADYDSNNGIIESNDITGTIIFYTANTFTPDTLFIDTWVPDTCCPDGCPSYQIIINAEENAAPIAYDDYALFEGACTSDTISLLDNDIDPGGGILTVTFISDPSSGTLVYDYENDILILTDVGDFIQYTVCNEAGLCDNGEISLVWVDCFFPQYPDEIVEPFELVQNQQTQIIVDTECSTEPTFINSDGNVSFVNDEIIYQAPTNFVGTDEFEIYFLSESGCCVCQRFFVSVTVIEATPIEAISDFVQIQGDCNTATIFPLENDELNGQDVTLTWTTIPGVDVFWDETIGAMTITSLFGGATMPYSICTNDGFCDEAIIEIDNLECFPYVFDEVTDTIFMQAGETVSPYYACPFLDVVQLPDVGEVVLTAGGINYTSDLNNTSDQTMVIYTGFEDPCCGPQICEMVTITFIITPPITNNDPPIANDDFGDIDACSSTITIYPLANDFDPDGDELTIVDFYIPDNGNITYDTITGAMEIEAFGGLETYYVVCDIENQCDTGDIFIFVTDCPAPIEEVLIIELPIQQGDSLPITIDFVCNPILEQIGEIGSYVVDDGQQYFVASETFVGFGDLFLTNYWDGAGCCVCQNIIIQATIEEAIQTGLPPVANNDFGFYNPGCEDNVVINPLLNDTDPEGGELFLVDFDNPPPGVNIDYDNTTGEMTISTIDDLVFTYLVCDEENLCDSATIEILVTDCPAPYYFNIEPLFTVEQGDSLTINAPVYCSALIEQQDDQLGEYIYENGELIFVASTTMLGTDIVSATFYDDDGCCACLVVDLTFNVIEPTSDNLPPIANDDSAFYIGACSTVSISLLENDSDPEGGSLTVTDISQPSSGTIEYDEENDILTLTNAFDFLQYTVCDEEGLCSIATIAIGFADCFFPEFEDEIIPVFDAFEGSTTDITIPQNCNTQPSVSGAEGIITYENGTVTYAAPSNFVGTDELIVSFLTEDGCCVCQNIIISVNIIEASQLIAVDDNYEVAAGCAIEIYPLNNDIDPEGNELAFFNIYNPELGQLNVNPLTNVLIYTAPEQFESDSFIYVICDDFGCDTATVTFMQEVCIYPPEPCEGDVQEVNFNESFTFNFNDADLFGDLTTVNNGTLTVIDDNTFIYQPAENFVGYDEIVCTFQPADCCSFTGVPGFYFNVNPPVDNTAPIANADVVTVQGECLDMSLAVLDNDINWKFKYN